MSTKKVQELLAFVRQLPDGMGYAPIYRNGAITPSGKISEGKQPTKEAWDRNLNPEEVASRIERAPDTFQAVGIWTGKRNSGLVILDVDRNLTQLKKKWGDTLLGAPVITSTKANAAKYLFRIPEALWDEVKGFGLDDSGAGYEVLWERQGVIYGAYPGSTTGNAPAGEYGFEGDLDAIPEAPEWLLAEMKDRYKKPIADGAFIKNRKGLDFSDRTTEEVAEIIQNALKVIPNKGYGSRTHWIKVGMAIHSELNTDLGLTLWSAWSAEDPVYAEDWAENRNPCEGPWKSFKKGEVTLGTLFYMADQKVPGRQWLPEDLRKIVSDAEARPVRFRQDYLDGQTLITKALELEDAEENPALLDQAKHLLGLEAGRRDGAISVDRMIDAHLSYERTKGSGPQPLESLKSEAFDYLIPGLLPKPWTLLLHADGGTGKTAMCQTIAKHLCEGRAFNVHGMMVPVKKSKVLWLNGDQNERILRRQFATIGVDRGIDVIGEWDMAWYRRFKKIQKKHEYDLIIIDSLDGCNDSNPYEENRREYAMPLKRLVRRNGDDFPACTIIVIHHNTKSGQYRGTGAIKSAVDETWNMQKLSNEQLLKMSVGFNSRLITVEKSRDDREGQRMVFSLMPDYTYLIGPAPEQEGAYKPDTPGQHTQDMLALMLKTQEPWSVNKFVELEGRLGGSTRKRAIQEGLRKLRDAKLIEVCPKPPGEASLKGRPPVYYRAVGTAAPVQLTKRGSGNSHENECVKTQSDCTGTDLNFFGASEKIDSVKSPSCTTPDPGAVSSETASTFYTADFLQSGRVNENPSSATEVDFLHASRVNRVLSPEDVEKHLQDALDAWDVPPAPLSSVEVAQADIASTQSVLEGGVPGVVDVSAESVQ